MEQHLGRQLTRAERVHHINGDRADNRIENLKLYKNHSEHMRVEHPELAALAGATGRKRQREARSAPAADSECRIIRHAPGRGNPLPGA